MRTAVLVIVAAVAALPMAAGADEGFRILSVTRDPPDTVNLSWRSDEGASYRVEKSPDLVDWEPLDTVAGEAGKETSYADNGAVGSACFYRVALVGQPPPGMALIPAGSFQMGRQSASGRDDELPVHTVSVSAFYLDRFEVTKALWDDVRNWGTTNGYIDLLVGAGQGPNHPVQDINWYGAVKWCNARSEMEGLTPVYYTDATQTTVYRSGEIDLAESSVNGSADGYRLPTEAEWEKAARGTLVGNRYPWGNSIGGRDANSWESGDPFEGAGVPTTPVGYYDGDQVPAGTDRANGYGLYDMAGNMYEWCWDWFDGGYYAVSPENDPRGPAASSPLGGRVLRGGSWFNDTNDLRCADRSFGFAPTSIFHTYGFRSARGH